MRFNGRLWSFRSLGIMGKGTSPHLFHTVDSAIIFSNSILARKKKPGDPMRKLKENT